MSGFNTSAEDRKPNDSKATESDHCSKLNNAAILSFVPAEKLTRTRVVEALNLLGKLASDENLTFELCIYGGSAMMLAYLGKFYPQETLAPKPREMIDGIVRGGP